MEKKLKIGIVVADNDEYAPIVDYARQNGGIEKKLKSFLGHEIPFGSNTIRTVLCGIGKVNAAVATTLLIEEGADMLFNFGLSGGINGVSRGETVVATRFLEHDFDLTPLGYKIAEKPNQTYIYDADERLVDLFKSCYKGIKSGTVVTGDSFICDANVRDMLKDKFDAIACDMETAAIAYPAFCFGVPFVSVRRISDDAGESATSDYREMNSLADSSLMEIVFDALKALNYAEF